MGGNVDVQKTIKNQPDPSGRSGWGRRRYYLLNYLWEHLPPSLWITTPVVLGLCVVAAQYLSDKSQTTNEPTNHSWGCWDNLGLSLLLLSVFVLAFWLPLFLVIIMLFVVGGHYYRD